VHPVVHVLEELLRRVAHLRFRHHEMPPHVDDLRDVLDVHGTFLLARAAGAAAPQLCFRDGGQGAVGHRLAEERSAGGILPAGQQLRADLAEMVLHVPNQLSRAQRHAAHVSRADVFATAAIRAGVEIQQTLPGELLDLSDAERFEGIRIVLQRGLDVGMGETSARLQIAEEDVEQPGEYVSELAEDQVADEREGGDGMEPPQAAVERLQALRVGSHQETGNRVSRGRPAREVGLEAKLRHRDPDAFDDEALHEEQQQ
jgi:hypothetical protein